MSTRTKPHTRRFSGPFQLGDRVRLTGPKRRMSTLTLKQDGEFHTHRGYIRHVDILGLDDASVITNSVGEQYLVERPTLSDFVMSMPRGAAIIYPKDAAQILAQADMFPGATVVEAGVGSGALSLWLLRAIGEHGQLLSIERRQEFADIALDNVTAFHGATPSNWELAVGDFQSIVQDHCDNQTVDRIVLDMLAPWECIETSASVLKPGGMFICYVATVTQLSRTVEAIRASGQFTHPESSETMIRGWHVEGLAVRPDHRMVAHTGFLAVARRLAPNTKLPQLKRRASKSEYSIEDLQLWTPDSLGTREKSGKALRKNVRKAQTLREDSAAYDE